MICPKCKKSDSKVIESRDSEDGYVIRRRRECLKCQNRFTTYERVEIPALVVKKKDGGEEPFDRAKLLTGLHKAVEKRPINLSQLEKVVNDIERQIFNSGASHVTSDRLGEMVMDHLMKLDDVAYVRFASVYRSFADVNSFEQELAKVRKNKHVKM
jgi:transcriptional repressor NrdR